MVKHIQAALSELSGLNKRDKTKLEVKRGRREKPKRNWREGNGDEFDQSTLYVCMKFSQAMENPN